MSSIVLSPDTMHVPDGTIYRIKSRDDYKNLLTGYEVVYRYKALAECMNDDGTINYMYGDNITIDINNAIIAMDRAYLDYNLKQDQHDCHIYFDAPCPINVIRKLWYDEKTNLDYMIETLDYVHDYTGDRYFKKYQKDPMKYENYDSDKE